MFSQFASAEMIFPLPRITAANCPVHWSPTSWNWGMPTYWMPGLPGRLLVPGSSIGADWIASSVGLANVRAAVRYSGISEVERRGPGGIAAHPAAILDPASSMYCGPVAQATYRQARSDLFE